jgi:hypothetical protein
LASAVVAAGLVFLMAGPAHADFATIGTEPAYPYAQPVDANVPKRGCATTLSDPTNAGASIPAVQVIYAWHAEYGNRYDDVVQQIAKIVDRMDWSVDESTNYDQHINPSIPLRGPAGLGRALRPNYSISD